MGDVNHLLSMLSDGIDDDTMRNDLEVLPLEFKPGVSDVICQRGKDNFEHSGNRRFRGLIEGNLDPYMKATSRREKSKIVSKVYEKIRCTAMGPSSGFVRKDLLTKRWYIVDEREAREKVGQAFRDATKLVVKANQSPLKGKSDTLKSTEAMKKKFKRDQTSSSKNEPISYAESLNRRMEMSSRLSSSTLFLMNQEGLFQHETTTVIPGAAQLLNENVEADRPGSMPNNMLSSSILPLHAMPQDVKGSSNFHPRAGAVPRSLSFESPYAAVRLNTNSGQGTIHDHLKSADFMMRMSASHPALATSFHPMLLQWNLTMEPPRQQQQQHQIGMTWDLEPTPVLDPQRPSNNASMDPRTAALANLLFPDGSVSFPPSQRGPPRSGPL